MESKAKKTNIKTLLAFVITALLTVIVFFIAINSGGLSESPEQLFKGMFIEYDKTVAIIMELRFPRVIVALLGGILMAVSGVLMQAVMRNPLADPGLIGVTAGSTFASVVLTSLFPMLAPLAPLFSFCGGMLAFALVYILAWNGNMSPLRLILTGVAIDALFTGMYNAFAAATGNTYTGAQSIINANISLKTWDDVRLMAIYFLAACVLCLFTAKGCNLLSLSDNTVYGLGVNVNRVRIIISVVSVLTASVFTSVIGPVSFLGLLVPHIARLLVGSNHKILIPYSAVLGALVFLAADTTGRLIAYPYEISPSIIMAVIGGPLFIILLKRSHRVYGK